MAEIQMKVVKQSKRNPVSRVFHAKSDKDNIVAWKQDLLRILQVFNVRSIGSIRHSLLIRLISDRADNQYQRDGCGYTSERVDDAGRHFQPKPLSRWHMLSIDNGTLIIA
jgi:hypothetical protein